MADREFRNLRTQILVHVTDTKAANNILIEGKLRCSKKGMLGPGVYFATNYTDAKNKAQVLHKDAIIVSAVNLGKLYEVYGPEKQLTLEELKKQNYDSVRGYKSNSPECKNFGTGTEYCVFEEERITPLFGQFFKNDGKSYFKLRTDSAVKQVTDFPLDRLVIEKTERDISLCDNNYNIFSVIHHPEPFMKGVKIIFTNEGDLDFTKLIHKS